MRYNIKDIHQDEAVSPSKLAQCLAPDMYREMVSLLNLGEKDNNIEYISMFFCEIFRRFEEKGRSKYFTKAEKLLQENEIIPINWYLRALDAVSKLNVKKKKQTKKNHNVYCILVEGFVKSSPYGVYVGETSKAPNQRFAEHKAGGRLAARRNKRFICLLPGLYERFNPLSREEAKDLEPLIYEKLLENNVRAFYG